MKYGLFVSYGIVIILGLMPMAWAIVSIIRANREERERRRDSDSQGGVGGYIVNSPITISDPADCGAIVPIYPGHSVGDCGGHGHCS